MSNPYQTITANQFFEKLANGELNKSHKDWTVKDEILITNRTDLDKIHLKNITFKKTVKIGYSTIQFGLFFENCKFSDNVTIERLKSNAYSHTQNIEDCNILFSNCQAPLIHIVNQCDFLRGIKIINESNIGNLLITDTKVDRGDRILIENSTINNILDLSRVDSKIDIETNVIKKLRVEFCVGDFSIINSTFDDWVETPDIIYLLRRKKLSILKIITKT